MERRAYLKAAGVTGLASLAGCLDTLSGGSGQAAEGTILGPPEQDLSAASHPSYGDNLPSFAVTDPFADEEITDDHYREERALMITFFYTSCPDYCPALVQINQAGQEDARANGYSDDAAFLAITFDPEYDTPEVIAEEAERMGIDYDSDEWHYLRPEDNDDAEELVGGRFGTPVEIESHGDHGDHDDHDHDHDDHDHGHDDDPVDHDHAEIGGDDEPDADEDGEPEESTGTHVYLTLLVNKDGIVERAYPLGQTPTSQIIDDLRTVAEA